MDAFLQRSHDDRERVENRTRMAHDLDMTVVKLRAIHKRGFLKEESGG